MLLKKFKSLLLIALLIVFSVSAVAESQPGLVLQRINRGDTSYRFLQTIVGKILGPRGYTPQNDAEKLSKMIQVRKDLESVEGDLEEVKQSLLNSEYNAQVNEGALFRFIELVAIIVAGLILIWGAPIMLAVGFLGTAVLAVLMTVNSGEFDSLYENTAESAIVVQAVNSVDEISIKELEAQLDQLIEQDTPSVILQP